MYKTQTLLIILLVSTLNVFSQTEKGNFFIGAGTSLDFSALKSQYSNEDWEGEEVSTSSFEFNSRVGYFLANNFTVGIDFLKTSAKEKDDGDVYKSNTFAIGPFARLYFGKNKIKPFIHSGFGWGKNVEKFDASNVHYSDQKVDANLTTFDAGGGVSFFISPRLALELSFLYGSATSKFKTLQNQDAQNKVNGIASSIGVAIHL